MIVLSLFDGISCGQLALKRANINVDKYYASEIDKYAIDITQKHFPNTIQIGDVKNIDTTFFNESIDLLIGGSPCQNLSIAGDRKGLEGSESKLFYEYLRLLKDLKPKYFLLENNSSMSLDNKNKISDLMGVQPIEINSAFFSGQQRKRLYWTNINFDKSFEDKNICVEQILDYSFTDVDLSNEVIFTNNYDEYSLKPVRIGYIGKGGQAERVYSIKAKSVTLTANGGGRGSKTGLYLINHIVRKLSPLECERLQTLPDNYTNGLSNTQRYKCIGNGWTVDVIAHIFKGLKWGHLQPF